MTTVKKSITRLLAERKALEDRIGKASIIAFIGLKKGITSPVSVIGNAHLTPETAAKEFQSNFNSVQSMIEYHHNITAAIIDSNAKTKVTIGTVEMTVAQAIERKRTVTMEQTFLNNARMQLLTSQVQIDKQQLVIENKIEEQQRATLGNSAKTATAEQLKAIADPYISSMQYSLIDPNKLPAWVQTKADAISTFLAEVDFTLSESNSKTELEVDDGRIPASVVEVRAADLPPASAQ